MKNLKLISKIKEENFMSQVNVTGAVSIEAVEPYRKGIYKLAAVAISISVLLMVLDIISTVVIKETIAFGTLCATDWFGIFQNSWFSGLRNLGLLNVIELVLSVPMLLAMYVTFRDTHKAVVTFAVALSLVGAAVYIANNAAIPMFVLQGKYAAAATDAKRSLLASAGEAILARGEDFTPGAFMGFILGEIASLIIAFVMLRSKVFGKITACIGIIGIGALSVFTICTTFIPTMYSTAMIIAMIGGPFGTVWYILIARRFFKLAG
jgi:hypothetical protein